MAKGYSKIKRKSNKNLYSKKKNTRSNKSRLSKLIKNMNKAKVSKLRNKLYIGGGNESEEPVSSTSGTGGPSYEERQAKTKERKARGEGYQGFVPLFDKARPAGGPLAPPPPSGPDAGPRPIPGSNNELYETVERPAGAADTSFFDSPA